MSFLAPRPTNGVLKRKSNDEDTSSHLKKYHHRVPRDVEFVDVGGDNLVSTSSESYQYWNVQWRLPQQKKHKTWDGDAVIAVTLGSSGSKCTLYDSEGRVLSTTKLSLAAPKPGDNFRIGDKEIEIDGPVSRADFIAGVCFGRNAPTVVSSPYRPVVAPGLAKKYIPVKPISRSTSSSSRHRITLVDSERENIVYDNQPLGNTHWMANWRASASNSKKHRPWEADGYVTFNGDKLTLVSDTGKILGKCEWKSGEPHQGQEFLLLGREVRLDSEVSPSMIPTTSKPEFMQDSLSSQVDSDQSGPRFSAPAQKFIAPGSLHAQPKKTPVKGPRHDPDVAGAIVMKAPSEAHQRKYNKKNAAVVPVVIDPLLSRLLRPHQIEGVKFLYESVMGMRKHEGQGCILADEMGMGKTLQTITLIWTLLKQSPYAGNPVIGKCLIACPVSLVSNWKKEFNKWIGKDKVGVFVGDKDKTIIKQFVNSKIHQVLIIGYERLKSIIADLAYCNPPIGLIICDEGHRLKSAQSKVNQMFKALRTPRRIILSGTPIQNDLSEFHAMADFCNPGLLDEYSSFKRLYETPILKSRTPSCSSKELELGNARSEQLLTMSKSFVLRRDASILSNYLPPKFEYVVFVKPSNVQLSIFAQILQKDTLNSLTSGSTAKSLALINTLTKISNSPILLSLKDGDKDEDDGVGVNEHLCEAMKLLPKGAKAQDVSLSGKLTALANMLRIIHSDTDEKCIIVSHYTNTLDVIQAFCDKKKYTYSRLDGRTPVSKRQEFVDNFNKSSQGKCFLFLLSAKAGGVGLNLIGASRLVLVDNDWNPSHDLQAMARIHRDGQKRPVFIYRLLTTGTIDEKIFQRQVTKMGLSDSLMANQRSDGSKSKSDSFSPQDLRNLFTIHSHTLCHTHDLLGCACSAYGDDAFAGDRWDVDLDSHSDSDVEMGWVIASHVKVEKLNRSYSKRKKGELAALEEWTHVNCMHASARDIIHDDILSKLISAPDPRSVQDAESLPCQTRRGTLFVALDSENILDANDVKDAVERDVDQISGGTLTFVFEKKAESSL